MVTQKEKLGNLVPRFADSALTMWLTDKCSLPQHIEQLSRLQKAKSGFVSLFNFFIITQMRLYNDIRKIIRKSKFGGLSLSKISLKLFPP